MTKRCGGVGGVGGGGGGGCGGGGEAPVEPFKGDVGDGGEVEEQVHHSSRGHLRAGDHLGYLGTTCLLKIFLENN